MIKFCIWDVGQVTYKYSLLPLYEWLKEHTLKLEIFEQRKGRFSFDDYMKGECSFEDMCKDLCLFYGVPYDLEKSLVINELLHKGIGEYIEETRKIREETKAKGIINGVLSNALPCLADALNDETFDKRYIFTSYQMHLLKPDKRIFERLVEQLDCRPDEICFIDDKLKNVDAARSVGINAYQYLCGEFHYSKRVF